MKMLAQVIHLMVELQIYVNHFVANFSDVKYCALMQVLNLRSMKRLKIM